MLNGPNMVGGRGTNESKLRRGLAKEQAGKKFAYVMVTRMSLCRALKNFKNAIPSIPTRSLLHRLIVSLFVLQNIQHVHGTDLHHD